METLYEKIGHERLKNIVDEFYDRIYSSEIAELFKGDKQEIAQKQLDFLTQFLGGPQLYTEKHGHPKMRMRHLPHAIDETSKEVWLRCMKEAINIKMEDDQYLSEELYNCFPRVAEHMINQ